MIKTFVPAPARPPSIAPALIQSMARELQMAAPNPEKHPRLRLIRGGFIRDDAVQENNLDLYCQ